MKREYLRRFRVRHYELDSFGHLNNAVYVKLMQEAAIEASTEVGYSPQWYRDHGVGWVIRKLSIRYYLQTRYGDELEIRTWVSDMKRATSHREYEVTRASDGAKVARARVNWVYVDLNTGIPKRIPPEFKEGFQPSDELDAIDIRMTKARDTNDSYHYLSQRRVQLHEVDTVQHVHHAVYLQWIEQAYFDAIRASGWPVEKLQQEDVIVLQGGHDIEYFEPAFDNDEIKIVSWICEMGRVRGAWTHEIYNAKTEKLLARDYSLGIFINSSGKMISLPQHALDAVLRGPDGG